MPNNEENPKHVIVPGVPDDHYPLSVSSISSYGFVFKSCRPYYAEGFGQSADVHKNDHS